MNKIQIIVDSVLAVAIIALFVLYFTAPKQTVGQETVSAAQLSAEKMPVAYLNLDTLLTNYVFAQEAQEKLMSKQEDARAKLNARYRTLQNEMADFQRKYDNNAFLSRERAENEAQRLQKKQQELQELEAKLTDEILQENQKLNLQMRDTLDIFLKEYNAKAGFQIIFANTQSDNILLAQPAYDITAEIVYALNQRYTK